MPYVDENDGYHAGPRGGGGGGGGPDWVGGIGSAIGGVANYFGQQSANATNIQLSREAQQFNAHEAAKNRDWQAMMSNSAYQRSMADMRAAGLNPMLAFSQGGASSPSGSSASGTAATVENAVGPALSTALQAATVKAQIDKIKSDTEVNDSVIDMQTKQGKLATSSAAAADAKAELDKVEKTLREKDVPIAEMKNELGTMIKNIFDKGVNSAKDFFRQNGPPHGREQPKKLRRIE